MRDRLIFSTLVFVACMYGYAARSCLAQAAPPLKLVRTIPMPQVKSRNPELNQRKLAESVDTEFMPNLTCHFDRIGL